MKFSPEVEEYRVKQGEWKTPEDFGCGIFVVPYKSFKLQVIVSDGKIDGWEHVSVSLKNRAPNWEEMCFIKDLFWDDDEVVVQYHPAKKDYVDIHPNCLHLWKCLDVIFPLPPKECV